MATTQRDTPALPQVGPAAAGDEERAQGGDLSAEEQRARRIDALGESLAKKRAEAISAREKSGIEAQWLEDEEFYQGIDDANRNEHSNAWRTKPPGQYQTEPKGATRSTVFPNITRPYCDAAAARIADMLLPTDDRSWSLSPTPVPDLVDISNGKIPPEMQSQMAQLGDQAKVDQMAGQLQQQAKQLIEDAKAKAEKAQTRIEDWHVEGQWHAEIRKVIEDAARIGTGVLKGPVPIKRKAMALVDIGADGKPAPQNLLQKLIGGVKSLFQFATNAAKALIFKEEIKPTSKRIDPWNFYPDGSCGENIHDGSGTWERDRLTPKQLQDLLGTPGYIESQIRLCLNEGPQKALAEFKKEPDKNMEGEDADKRFEIWYYHGTINRDDLMAAECECDEEEHPIIPAMITMVNNRVIKAAMNPLDSGDYPYDVMPWQRKSGMPWGNGVARQGRTPQRITTAATRNMMDNGGLSAGPQIVLMNGIISPADGQWAITPRKVWYAAEDANVDDIRKAMQFFEIPSRQKELMEIIQFGLKMMEDSTGMPALLQGQIGQAKNQPLGTVTIANNNASAVLRRLARTFDDCITEPHIRRYYTWLLQYGEDSEKGDFTIDARGSSALVERDLQAQEISQMGAIVTNPVFGLDPKKWARELLKSRKFDPKNFEFDDEEWKKIIENMQKGGDPRVAVAQMRAQLEEKLKQMDQAFEAAENEKDRNLDLILSQVDERIAEIKQSGAKEISFAEMKTILAETVIKVRAQRDLSQQSHVVDLHKHHTKELLKPPVEPAGRAPAGKSFQA